MTHTEAIKELELIATDLEYEAKHLDDNNASRKAAEIRASIRYLSNSLGVIGLPVKGDVS